MVRFPQSASSFNVSRFRPQVTPLDDRITPTLAFANSHVFSVGSEAESVAVADFDRDGRPDFAAANRHVGGTVTVVLNTTPTGASAATYSGAFTFAVGNDASALAVGDFNGDGHPDILAANATDDTVSVLRNLPFQTPNAPSFATQQTFAVGNGPTALAVADFNADGRLDFATVNAGDGTLSVRLNTTATNATTFTFATPPTVTPGGTSASLAVADFNADARPDLVVADTAGNHVAVLLNSTQNGSTTATFALAQVFAVGTAPGAVAVGDFNSDGRADVAVANSGDNNVSVLLNTTAALATTPAFAAPVAFAAGTGPNSITVGDFDGDGRPDLAVTSNADATVSVLVNSTAAGAGTPSFAAPVAFATPVPVGLATADFNSDGRLDLVAGTTGIIGQLSLFLNQSTGGQIGGQALVGQFGTTGVWRYNRIDGTWARLHTANATALATAATGNVVGSFGGLGVLYYRPATGWAQITGVPVDAVGMDPLGNAYISSAGYGVFVYRLATGTWTRLTTQAADKLAVSANGDVVANFGNFGVYRYRPTTGWVSLSTPNATALAVGEDGTIAAHFALHGTYRFKAGTWVLSQGVTTSLAVDQYGGVAANNAPGYGTSGVSRSWNGTQWTVLHYGTPATTIAMDLYGNVFATFTGYGLYRYDRYSGWHQIRASDASILVMG